MIARFAITLVLLASLWSGTGMAAQAASEPAVADATAEKLLPEEDNLQTSNTVILQGLNKVTGRVSKLEGPIGVTQRFGSLEIIPRRCWKSSPEDRPENAALLEVRELQIGEESKRIFLGWMFSSSPGLAGLEHAVYDISVVSCEFHADPESNAPVAAEATSPAEVTAAKPLKKTSKTPKKLVPKNGAIAH